MNEKVFGDVCVLMCEGASLRTAAKKCGTSHSLFLRFLGEAVEPTATRLRDQYTQARAELVQARYDALCNMVSEEPEYVSTTDGNGETTQTRIDPAWVALLNVKRNHAIWDLSKLAPKDYGDKIDVAHSGEVSKRVILEYGKKPNE